MKNKDIIEQLTLLEKAALLSGKNVWQTRDIPRLGIPSIFLSDGPHGLRKQLGAADHLGLNKSQPATCFPPAATVANSWNPQLGEEIGAALGEEALELEVDVVLGPGLNIKRSPLCGRNFEYFSEDPYLSGKMAAGYVRGIQSKGVSACLKHFAVNNQELRRMASNSVVDARTLRELYLTGFEIAVKEAAPKSVMTSYNEVNGRYANENAHLLKEILRDEWGFDGFVVTDWGGSNDHVEGVRNGSTLEMPSAGLGSARELVSAVEEGRIGEEELNVRVDELLEAVFRTKATEKPKSYDREAHHALARKAAEESIVLLKNENGILPLKGGAKVAVIGDFAKTPRYQGAGSSVVNPTKLDTTLDLIETSGLEMTGFSEGFKRSGGNEEALKKSAVEVAKAADAVLMYIGLDEISETEGLDRRHMKLAQNQIELLQAVSAANPNVIAIISAGSVIEMPWKDNCRAIVHGYLSGQAGAGAMLRVITGEYNPSGKLGESYPFRYEDTPAYNFFPGKQRTAEYREGLYVGYRYYQTINKPVCYPFGYGLSYTTFSYSDLYVTEDGAAFTITNTGMTDGAEAAQLYVSCKNGKVFRPVRELKGFCKVFLRSGESKTVSIPLDDKTFRYFNIETNSWEIETAEYEILIGSSAENIRLCKVLTVRGSEAPCPYSSQALPDYYSGKIQSLPDDEFAALLGYEIPDGSWSGELGINDALCQMEYAKSGLARLIYKILDTRMKRGEAKGTPDLNALFQLNMPFRGIAKMTNGIVSMEMAAGMVTLVNGKFFKGMGIIINGFFRNSKANRRDEAILREKNN